MKLLAPPATLTVAEAHAIVGETKISRNGFYAAVRRGDIPSIRWGRRLLIPADKFQALVKGESDRQGRKK